METKNAVIEWVLVQSHKISASVEQFWTAMDIYTKRSHIINRRLIGGEILGKVIVQNDQHLLKLHNIFSNYESDENVHELIKKENGFSESTQKEQHRVAIIKKLLPKKNSSHQSLEIIENDYAENRISFLNSISINSAVPCFFYAFSYKEGVLNLLVEESVKETDPSYSWIVSKLVPKLIKWMENVSKEKSAVASSLCLVPVTEYSILYQKLKETYGKQLVQMWPENTDPLKFVYEDIGIATYLMLLWSGKPKQRFVDLGCGNGLLVHILNSEGHLGVGYDLRPRKIWAMYPPSTKLEVRTIIPSSETVFPDADWLIGNHSDELTVWIPVMAACSSYSCNFFLLPCCPYEFNGRKYCRADTSVSQYSDFLSYVESVCKECGIDTNRDKLRIPSTKRICFVGNKRTYRRNDLKENLDKLLVYVNNKCGGLQCSGGQDEQLWCPQFKPRSEERVRNCTQVHMDIRESIVSLVAEQVLAKRRNVAEGWNHGGVVEISAVAKLVPTETLKKLKNECGGLQTLLKNHHYIFKVHGGKVEFRVPTEKIKSESGIWKKKQCWFYHNHPNSCPLVDEQCSFIHDV